MDQVSPVDRKAFYSAIGIAVGFLVFSSILQVLFQVYWPHSLRFSIDRFFTDFVVLRGQHLFSTVGLTAFLIVKLVQSTLIFWFFFAAFRQVQRKRVIVASLLILLMVILIPFSKIQAL